MPLANGRRIGPFEISGWLGAGGMGDVYRARDTRLQRDVAIKLIAERLAAVPGRVRRFEQEARAAGQLNHPNILAVYDVGVYEGMPYLVSELLEGESLRTRLGHGALATGRAIDYARQIANGLADAHGKGIVHRDLKPDNLFVTSDHRIKILDFGLAKLVETVGSADAPDAETEVGTVLGTVGYMSPEQVRGESIDARSDIFSLGIVLHEMLTGSAPFARATKADTMAAILKDDPLASLPDSVPPSIERILSRCLEKAREARFQSARDLAFALDGTASAESPASTAPRFSLGTWRLVPWTVAATVAIVFAVAFADRAPRRSAPERSGLLRLTADLGAGESLGGVAQQYGNAIAISRDGSTLAFVGQKSGTPPQLYVRRLDERRARSLPGTDGANAPFFSPDGLWIGFETGLELKKVAVTGGAPMLLASVSSPRGASWSDDGTIIFSPTQQPGTRLMQISASGGTPSAVTTLSDGETIHLWPSVLPDARAVVYTSSRVLGAFNDANLVLQPLPQGTPKVIQRGGYHGVYVRSGHIVYVHDGALMALPFDAERLEPTGSPVRVLEGLQSNGITGGAQFSIADNGTIVYLTGPSLGTGSPIDLVDREGRTTTFRAAPSNWFTPAFAPDGRRLAVSVREGPTESEDIWLYESTRDAAVRVTNDVAYDQEPVWTPDGRRLTFASKHGGDSTTNLYWRPGDGSGTTERLTTSANEQRPGSWHPSGRFLAFEELHDDTMRDVMILPVDGNEGSGWRPGAPTTFVSGPRMDWAPRFSPDGRWLAYTSNESGRQEVYVRPFPGPGPSVQVSSAGGEMPIWSATRNEVIYGLEGQVIVAPFSVTANRFAVARPYPWPRGRYQTRGRNRMFDVHPDGERVVLALAASPSATPKTTAEFVFNYFDELRRIAPPASVR